MARAGVDLGTHTFGFGVFDSAATEYTSRIGGLLLTLHRHREEAVPHRHFSTSSGKESRKLLSGNLLWIFM